MTDSFPGATRDPWVRWLSQASTIATALYLLVSGLTFDPEDAHWVVLDARWLYVVAAVIGAGAAFIRKLRGWWLAMLLICTLGRAATLLVAGSPSITDRTVELRGALGWFVLWVAGSLPMFALQASDIIRGRVRPGAGRN